MIANAELRRQYDRINGIATRAMSLFEPDDEMLSEIAKYNCVLCSGFLENSIAIMFSDFARNNTHNQNIINYVGKCLNRIQNPKKQVFLDLIQTFNFDWSGEFTEYLNHDERGSSINYIITERHRIAHGDNSEITMNRLIIHFSKAVEVVEFIESRL